MDRLPLDADQTPRYLTEIVHRLKIRDAMSRELATAAPETSMRVIQDLMKEKRITGVPIVRNMRLAGMVSIDDIIHALDLGHIDEPASRHMTRQIIALEDDMPLSFGLSYMDKFHFGRFPVLNRDKELVGIITSRDILIALLVELNREAEQRESSRVRPIAGETHRHEFTVRQFDFEHAGEPTDEIKLLVREIGLPPKMVRRIAVACYEIEMNMVVHSAGGIMTAIINPSRIVIEARDRGPGIADVAEAMREGFTTAPEWIRSLGFGAGMGLPNAKRMADGFRIDTGGAGTTVSLTFDIPAETEENTE